MASNDFPVDRWRLDFESRARRGNGFEVETSRAAEAVYIAWNLRIASV